jgi:O-antigen/teichoic acid export membrane protein
VRKQFLRDSIFYVSVSVANALAGFLMLPVYTRTLSPSEYGTVELLGVIISIAQIIFGLEIGQALVRFYPDSPDEDSRRQIFSTSLNLVLVGQAILLCAILAATQLSSLTEIPGFTVTASVAFLAALLCCDRPLQCGRRVLSSLLPSEFPCWRRL